MKTYTHQWMELTGINQLFPDEIEHDGWIAYHATSSALVTEIEKMGLLWRACCYSKAEIAALVTVYDTMKWGGLHRGGYAVLKGFSLLGDFHSREEKPIFFREHSRNSLIYALRDFAGGETARAVRHAFFDLGRYVEDATVREAHLRRVMTWGEPFEPVDLTWLENQVSRLAPLRRRCMEPFEAHEHGVVYAVQFRAVDLPFLKHNQATGLQCFKPVAPDRLTAKALLLGQEIPEAADPLRNQNINDVNYLCGKKSGTLCNELKNWEARNAKP